MRTGARHARGKAAQRTSLAQATHIFAATIAGDGRIGGKDSIDEPAAEAVARAGLELRLAQP